MDSAAPLVTTPVSFFEPHTGHSVFAVQHIRADGRTALLFHDAQGIAAARPLLAAVAASLMADLPEGHTLSLIESGVPEHPVEPFVYARVTISSAAYPGRLVAGTGHALDLAAVARACGVAVREVERTQLLVRLIHRPRSCAFPGFRQLPLGDRGRRALVAA